MPGCTLNLLRNKKNIKENNLIVLDVECRNITSASNRCLSQQSFISYKCRNGFIFQNDKGIYLNIVEVKNK